MNVQLSQELEEMVTRKVQAGRYRSPEDLVEAALELIALRDELLEFDRSDLAMNIQEGLESLESEEPVDGDLFFDASESRLKAAIKAKSKTN